MRRSRHNLKASQSGALNKLGEDFFASLCADFEAHGADIISQLCEQNPRVFLRVIAGLVREQPEPDSSDFDKLSAEELDRMLEALAARS